MNRGIPSTGHVGLMLVGGAAIALNQSDGANAGDQERILGKTGEPPNNGMQLTRGASEASGLRRPHHSLMPLAADPECSTGLAGNRKS
jgi:hypothetical protein